jgi:hypothetical protein
MDSEVREFDMKICYDCRWFAKETYVCVNDSSDHLADFVMPNKCCPEWEEKIDITEEEE